MKTDDFIKICSIWYNPIFREQKIKPRIICNDGFKMSVQGSQYHYCKPRIDTDSYSELEIGYPTEKENLILKFAEDRKNPCDTVYPYVPIELIDKIIKKHKGINIVETFKK